MVQKTSKIYNVYENLRGKAKEYLVRPTLGQTYKSSRKFNEITSRVPLTWPGSTHFEEDVVALGGEVFDTGNGTIGKFTGSSVPDGWTQADNWQKYNSSTFSAGDDCGRFKGSATTTFSNIRSVKYTRGSHWSNLAYGSCSVNTNYWHYFSGTTHALYRKGTTLYNSSTNRVEVGIY